MTTPNQGPPEGAVTVGGGEFKYGQLVNERRFRQQFELEAPSNLVEALQMLPHVLNLLPNDALRPFQKWLNVSDEETANGTIRQRLIDSLGKNRLTKNEENNQGIVDGIDGSVNGGSPSGRPLATVRENLQEAWSSFWRGHTGQSGTGKLPSDVQSAAAGVASAATTASSTAAAASNQANTAVVLAENIVEVGSNIIVNPGFESGLFAQGAGTYSTEQARTGDRSLRMASTGTVRKYYFLSDDSNTRFIPVRGGDVFFCQVFVRGKSSNTQTGGAGQGIVFTVEPFYGLQALDPIVLSLPATTALNTGWTELSGYVTMPTTASRMRISIGLTAAVANSSVFYWDDAICREVTLAKTANDKAISAEADAAVANTNAGAAQNTADTAVDLSGQIIDAGSNLIVNPDFEKGLLATQPLVAVYATEQYYSGTRSLKFTANGTTKTYYLLSEGITPKTIPAAPDDTLYCEFYVYGNGITTTVANGFRMVFEPQSRFGANLTDQIVGVTVSTALNQTWTKVTGFAKMPANTARFKVALQVLNTVSTGLIYVDQVICREVTVGKTALETVDLKARDATNLAAGSDFEGERQPWTFGIGWALDDTYFYAGTKSLKRSGTTSGTSTLAGTFACLPGEQFVIECYARRDSAFNGTIDRIRLMNQANTEIGSLYFNPAALPTAGIWTKLTTTVTVPAGTNAITVQAFSTSTLGAVWLDNIVIRRVVTAETVGELPQSKVANLPSSLTTLDGKAQGAIDGIGQGIDGGSASYTQANVKTRMQFAWAALWDGLRGTSGATAKLPADVRTEAAALKSLANTTSDSLTATNTNQGTLVDYVNTGLSGEDNLTNTSLPNALQSFKRTFRELSEATTSIQELKAKRDGTVTKGATFNVNFSDFTTVQNAGFTVTSTGADLVSSTGTSSIGISGGVAQWTINDSQAKDAKIIYSQSTATDFQSVRGSMAAPPQVPNGATPYFYALARVSPDGLTYVWARAYAQSFGNYKADIGYTLNGVSTTWKSGINLTWSLDMRFVAGLGTDARQYQIWSGNNVVYTHPEVGTNSRLCSDNHAAPSAHTTTCVKYRQWGAIAQVRNGKHSGKVSSTAATDTGTPTVVGSYARLTRTSGTASFVGGQTLTALNGSFFDAAPFESLDIDADPLNSRFKVTTTQPYLISARVALNSGIATTATLLLQRSTNNGTSFQTVQHGNVQQCSNGEPMTGTWIQYLNAGEMVQLAYTRTGTTVTNGLTGDSAGSQTYFTITPAGNVF